MVENGPVVSEKSKYYFRSRSILDVSISAYTHICSTHAMYRPIHHFTRAAENNTHCVLLHCHFVHFNSDENGVLGLIFSPGLMYLCTYVLLYFVCLLFLFFFSERRNKRSNVK